MATRPGRHDGVPLPENFDHPYVSTSIQEFWRRWHMSLSPVVPRLPLHPARRKPRVAAARVREPRDGVLPLRLVHGAKWTVRAWGLYHGAFLVLERLGFDRAVARARASWPCLRAARGDDRLGVLPRRVAACGDGVPASDGGLQGVVDPPFSVRFFPRPARGPRHRRRIDRRRAVDGRGGQAAAGTAAGAPRPATCAGRGITAAFALVFLAATLFIASSSYSPFIYFQF